MPHSRGGNELTKFVLSVRWELNMESSPRAQTYYTDEDLCLGKLKREFRFLWTRYTRRASYSPPYI